MMSSSEDVVLGELRHLADHRVEELPRERADDGLPLDRLAAVHLVVAGLDEIEKLHRPRRGPGQARVAPLGHRLHLHAAVGVQGSQGQRPGDALASLASAVATLATSASRETVPMSRRSRWA
jgi:hypothetical protein